MGIKKFFDKITGKEDEPSYFDLKLTDLKMGFLVDYDMKSWEVTGVYEYDWGNNFFTKEYRLNSGDDLIFVHLEDDDELSISVSRKEKVMKMGADVKPLIIKTDNPPNRIYYNNKNYFLAEDSQGYFREVGSEDWSEFVSWEFTNEDETEFINLERWSESDIEGSVGRYAQEFEFSNFLPREGSV